MRALQKRGVPVLLAALLLLTGCGGAAPAQGAGGPDSPDVAKSGPVWEDAVETEPSGAVLKTAWQYIVSRIETDSGVNVADASVDRLERLGRRTAGEASVDVYALDYRLYREGAAEGDPTESVCLFLTDGEAPVLRGVRKAEGLPSASDWAETAGALASQSMELSKRSTACTLLSEEEMESAVEAAGRYYAEQQTVLTVNIWYDEAKYSEELEVYRESSLYGMGEAAKSGNLIVLYGDLVFSGDEPAHLCRNWKMILKRDGPSSPWVLIDAGYG